MLRAFVAESIASQHPVFKSNIKFSIADCSAARLPESKKDHKFLIESGMGRNSFLRAGLDVLQHIFRWIHVLTSVYDGSTGWHTLIKYFFYCCREL